jgi:hypothetical protein
MNSRTFEFLSTFLLTAIFPLAGLGGQPGGDPRTIEYVVRVVHLESPKPIVPDVAKATAGEISKALDAWRQAGLITRMTTMRTTSRDGKEAVMETVHEEPVNVEESKFRWQMRNPNPKNLIPATEQRTTLVSLAGRIEKNLVVAEMRLVDKVVWEPRADRQINLQGRPMILAMPQEMSGNTTVAIRDGASMLGPRITSTVNGMHYEQFAIVTARILRAEK